MSRLLLRPRAISGRIYAGSRTQLVFRGLSTSSNDDQKIKTVKAATEQWLNAVGGAMPGKATIAAALIAASPAYSGKVSGLYDSIAKVIGAPTNEALKQLHGAIIQLAGTSSPSAPGLMLPPAKPNSTNAANSSSNFALVHDWIRQQPPEKTCGQLAEELQKFSESANTAPAPAPSTPIAK